MSNIVDLPTKTKPPPTPIKLRKKLDLGLAERDDECAAAEPKTRIKYEAEIQKAASSMAPIISGVKKAARVFKRAARAIKHFYYRMVTPALLGRLVSTARRLNRKSFHVFITISGHTDDVYVRVYPQGWNKDRDGEITLLQGYLPGSRSYAQMAPRDLYHAIRTIKALSKLSRKKGYKKD